MRAEVNGGRRLMEAGVKKRRYTLISSELSGHLINHRRIATVQQKAKAVLIREVVYTEIGFQKLEQA